MKRTEEVALFLVNHPTATNLEIADELGISEGYAKKLFHDLKSTNIIEVSKTEDGKRTVSVEQEKISNKRVEKNIKRKERIEQLLDIVFEAIEHENKIENIIAGGHLIIKLIDRL